MALRSAGSYISAEADDHLIFRAVVAIDRAYCLPDQRADCSDPVSLIVFVALAVADCLLKLRISRRIKTRPGIPGLIGSFKPGDHPGRRILPTVLGQLGHII